MASLKEIKTRIGSVRNTLKVTSAMKLVASAKLKKAQSAIGRMSPYRRKLDDILLHLLAAGNGDGTAAISAFLDTGRAPGKVAVVCFSSHSALCGGFNANVTRKVLQVLREYQEAGLPADSLTVYAFGRKIRKAVVQAGYPAPPSLAEMFSRPDYALAAKLGQELIDGYVSGRFDRVELIYNHFHSTGSQPVVREIFLPFPSAAFSGVRPQPAGGPASLGRDYILEPGREELLRRLLPEVLKTELYAVMWDTAAAEHAARTVAMQTATDNGDELLDELTLEYNKKRQQRITNELLDLAGGSAE